MPAWNSGLSTLQRFPSAVRLRAVRRSGTASSTMKTPAIPQRPQVLPDVGHRRDVRLEDVLDVAVLGHRGHRVTFVRSHI